MKDDIRFQKLNKNLANLLTRQKKAPLKPLELQEEVLSIINEYPLQTGDDDKVRAASADAAPTAKIIISESFVSQ